MRRRSRSDGDRFVTGTGRPGRRPWRRLWNDRRGRIVEGTGTVGRRRRMTMTLTPTLEPIGRVLTPEEYDALPENSLRELVDGVIQMMATPTPLHQDVAIALRN